MIFLKASGGEAILLLSVHAQPGASRTKIVGEYDGCLKVAVQSPPVDGAANEAIADFLGEVFGLSRKNIGLKSGATGRKKIFTIAGLDLAAAQARLREHL
jgi:uncharacterized protein (TIGR00251 family)